MPTVRRRFTVILPLARFNSGLVFPKLLITLWAQRGQKTIY
jgi:hypothetical protein